MDKFNIFKNKFKEKDNQPDYVVSYMKNDEWTKWGACWLNEKEDPKTGEVNKFFSCVKDDGSYKKKKKEENSESFEDVAF